jgi:hypothetical protein
MVWGPARSTDVESGPPSSCSERDADADRAVSAEPVCTDEVIDVGTSDLRVGVVESDRGLDVETAHGIDPNAELAAEVEDRPGVKTPADLTAGVEDGGRGDAEVEGDHLVESEGCPCRSAKDAARSDRAFRVPLADSIEEVARPDEAAQEEPEVVRRKRLELAVDDAVGRDQRGRNRSPDQVKAGPEVEAEMPVALEHRSVGCSVALTAPDELDAFVFTHRMPLGVGLAAVGSPTAILASAERFEVAFDLGEIGTETVDLRGVDEYSIEARAEQVPLFRVAPHPILTAGVLEAIETFEDPREIHALDVTLDHTRRRSDRGIEAVGDVEGRAGFGATPRCISHHGVTPAQAERHRSLAADRDAVPAAATEAIGDSRSFGASAAALDHEAAAGTGTTSRTGLRSLLFVGAGADDQAGLTTGPEEAHDVRDVAEDGAAGGRAVEHVRDALEERCLRHVHIDTHAGDLGRFRVRDRVARVVGSGERVETRVGRAGRDLDPGDLGARHRRDAEDENEADRERDEEQVGGLHGNSSPNLPARWSVTPGGGRVDRSESETWK